MILSHDLWQRQFNTDENILGRVITLNNRSFAVVGVMPADFQFPIQAEPIELWTTMAVDSNTTPSKNPLTADRGSHYLKVVARLKPGVSIAQAKAEMDTIALALEKQSNDLAAAQSYEQTANLDAQFAELQFRWAACLLPLRNSMTP